MFTTLRRTSSTTFFFFSSSAPHRDLHSFPTRRSSDLKDIVGLQKYDGVILSNVSSLKLTRAQMTMIRDYVRDRSEEHTSELQSHSDLVCRLLLEKKNIKSTRSWLRTKSTRKIVERSR